MIAIIDYGVGNLFSLTASLNYLGAETKVTSKKEDLEAADKIILPGVGAFEDAIAKLHATGLVDTILEQVKKGKPMLGICLGMQLLFEESHEYGVHKGLGLIKGTVASITDDLKAAGAEKVDSIAGEEELKVPHIGWNALRFDEEEPLFKNIHQGDCVYYVHSFYGRDCEESTIATSQYGITITGAVRNGNVYGTQFHPEKSGKVGMGILRAFIDM
ncbi:MAG: imidazole glycerol phosphate synthase subunit HisH [Firmicutes bacterium]|nr:imidazole glycerol phosphate synthase subunit HisH [Bacillota bacterium]